MKALIIISLMTMLTTAGFSQTSKTNGKPAPNHVIPVAFALKAKGYNDKIVLRWGVNNVGGWAFVQQNGVWIERMTMNKQNKVQDKTWKRLNEQPVVPFTEDKFKTALLTDTSDQNMLIAAEGVYGKASIADPAMGGLTSIKDAAMEYENKFALAMLAADFSPKAADAMGLRWEDKLTVDTTFKYVYRVYSAVKDPVFKTDTAYYIYAGSSKNDKRTPALVNAFGKDGLIEVRWPKAGDYNTYSSYNVERSEDGKTFRQINKKALIYSSGDSLSKYYSFNDTVKNYHLYYYRVNGTDAFGDKSGYSRVVKGIASDKTAPPAAHLSARISGKNLVSLSWKPAPGTPAKSNAGFIIKRGLSVYDINQIRTAKMIPAITSTYTDKIDDPSKGMYYQLVTVDTAGNYASSQPVYVFAYDTIPPAAPKGLKGKIDSAGRVMLSWNLDSLDNIIGYRIFISNNPTRNFSPITPSAIDDIKYIDTVSMRRLDAKIYYKIVAVDGNNNPSKYSEVLTLTRPDVLPPMPPVINDYKVNQKAVWLGWSASPSKDVQLYSVFRKSTADTVWKLIKTLPKSVHFFTDSTVKGGSYYTYAIQAVDQSKLSSPKSFPLSVKVYSVGAKGNVSQVELHRDERSFNLSWKLTGERPSFYIIYKDTGAGLTQYKSADSAVSLFKEPLAAGTAKVRYAVKAIFPDQTETGIIPSDWLTAR